MLFNLIQPNISINEDSTRHYFPVSFLLLLLVCLFLICFFHICYHWLLNETPLLKSHLVKQRSLALIKLYFLRGDLFLLRNRICGGLARNKVPILPLLMLQKEKRRHPLKKPFKDLQKIIINPEKTSDKKRQIAILFHEQILVIRSFSSIPLLHTSNTAFLTSYSLPYARASFIKFDPKRLFDFDKVTFVGVVKLDL